MAFRWKRFGQWVLLALGLIVLGTFLLMGGPGMILYLVWLVLLNVTFQREVIAKPPEGGGLWAAGLYLSFLTPLGLPLGYIVASLLPIASLQRLPFLRHRLTWLLLFALLWSLLMVIWINAPAGEAKKSSSYLSREFALTLPNQKTQGTADFTVVIAFKPQNFAVSRELTQKRSPVPV